MQRSLRRKKAENTISVRYFSGLDYRILIATVVSNVFFQLSQISSSIFLYIGTLVMVGVLFFIDTKEYINLSISYISVLRFATIANVSVLNLITIIYFFKAYIVDNEYKKEKHKRRLPQMVVISGIVLIMYCMQYMFDGTGFSGLRIEFIAIKLMLFLIYLVDIFRNCESKAELKDTFMKMQVYYIYGILVAIFVSILINPSYSLDATRMSLSEGSGSNQLGISLTFCLVLVTLGVTTAKNFKEWLVLIITALPLLYFCFATQSRTCIVGMIITIVCAVVFGTAQKESRRWVLLMALGVVVVLGGMILFAEGTQIHQNIMQTIDRFINPKNDDISNGRIDLWQIYIEKLKNNAGLFFFGGQRTEYMNTMAHNMFLEIFAVYGFFGTIIVIWIYSSVFVEIRRAILRFGKSTNIKVLGFLPLAIVFITGMVSHSLLNTQPTITFCMGVAMIYLYGENNTDENTLVDSDESGNRLISKRKRTQNLRRLDSRNGKKLRSI